MSQLYNIFVIVYTPVLSFSLFPILSYSFSTSYSFQSLSPLHLYIYLYHQVINNNLTFWNNKKDIENIEVISP